MDKFKKLIVDAYNRKLIGKVYTLKESYNFEDITNVNNITGKTDLSVLYLKSRYTDAEIKFCVEDLEDYKVKESEETIYVKCKNKMEVGLMY